MEQENTVWLQVSVGNVKIGSVVFRTHVLEHANGNDAVELFVQVAVVLKPDIDIQLLATCLRHFLLLS